MLLIEPACPIKAGFQRGSELLLEGDMMATLKEFSSVKSLPVTFNYNSSRKHIHIKGRQDI